MLTDPGAEPVPVQPVVLDDHGPVAEPDGVSDQVQVEAGSGSRRSVVPASIADHDLVLPPDLAAEVEEASSALARFESDVRAALGPEGSAFGPVGAILRCVEAISSSEIAGLTVEVRQLVLAQIGQSDSAEAMMVEANVRALDVALGRAKRLDERAIRAVQAALVSGQPEGADRAGCYRTGPGDGASGDGPPGGSSAVPEPEHVPAPELVLAPEHVPAAMEDLVRFIGRDDLPGLVQAAVAQAQFETIGPFADGNGRTGRALVQAILRGRGILSQATVPVSAGLLADTASHLRALRAFHAGDARPIIEELARASRRAATTGTRLVADLAVQLDQARARLADLRPEAVARKVVPHLVARPVINARYLIDNLKMGDMTAQRALAQLTDAGVLAEHTGRRRHRIWEHGAVLQILDDHLDQARQS